MTESTKLYSLGFDKLKTYGIVILFVIGNLVLPQLCHLLPNGGAMLLPIYFFTLIAAYKYGLIAGLLTAILSPVMNYTLFGMPTVPVLPIMVMESVLLAIIASEIAKETNRITFWGILLTVFSYQIVSTLIIAVLETPDFAINQIKVSIPGIILQIIGGYLLLKYVLRK